MLWKHGTAVFFILGFLYIYFAPMKRKSILLLFLLVCFPLSFLTAREIRVGIFYGYSVCQIDFISLESGVQVFTDSNTMVPMCIIAKDVPVTVKNENSGLSLYMQGHPLGEYSRLYFLPLNMTGNFRVKTNAYPYRDNIYTGELEILPNSSCLRLVNVLNIEVYLNGVVQSEVGIYSVKEFLKAQALCARTYTLKNLSRHANEGFNLCDNVHCQVYSGNVINNIFISEAVNSTKKEIILYYDQPIQSLYHACCGGYTANSEDVWGLDKIPYLRSVHDIYCGNASNANWSMMIPKKDFISTLTKAAGQDVENFYLLSDASGRVKGINVNGENRWDLNGKFFRTAIKAKSAKISFTDMGDEYLVRGNGSGHGVGLCQEGAMEMARKGFSYHDILKFYYTDISFGYYEETAQ